MKVDYIFHITPEASETIQKVAETLAQAIASDKQLKQTSVDEAKDLGVVESTKESSGTDQGKLNIEFNFGEEFESITKILDEKLKTFSASNSTAGANAFGTRHATAVAKAFSAPDYKPTFSKKDMPEPDIIKQITSSLAGYHDLFNEITCIQQPQANLLIVDRFTKGNPIHHKRYMLNVDKNQDKSYTLRVALDDFTLSFQFTSENIVNTVRHLVKVVISSDVID